MNRASRLVLPLCALLAAPSLRAQEDTARWLRNAAISPDGRSIAFCYQGDIWRVPASGGDAVPLTLHEAYDHTPVWSHDGRLIAFSSTRLGSNDVFVMPAEGGAPTRLTFHSNSEVASAFTPNDGEVLFYGTRQDDVRHQQFPVGGMGELYAVPVRGGRPVQVSTIAMQNARPSRDGRLIAYHDRKGYEDNWRKHHSSSVTRDVWTFEPATGTYRQLTTYGGEDRDPVWSRDGSTIYYLTEESGSFNVHRMPATGGASTPVSRFTDHPVRHLSISDDGVLCFSFRGELYSMTGGGTPRRVPIRIRSDGRYDPERRIAVDKADEFALSPNGKETVFVHRGEVFVTSVAEGTTRRITSTPGQERNASFSPDGRSILYASERGTSWDLYCTRLTRKEEKYFFSATVLQEEAVLATPAEEFQCAWSPDGKEVAYLEERTTLKVLNIASGRTRTILPGDRNYSYADGDQWYQWSPDGKWFTVGFLHPRQWIVQVGLVSAEGGKEVYDLTRSGYGGDLPRWAMGGEALVFLSARDGQKNHASWGGEADAYAFFLTRKAYDRFKLSKEDAALLKEEEDKRKEEDRKAKEGDKSGKGGKDGKDADAKGDKDEELKPITIEFEGLRDRKVRLTPNSSALSDAVLSKDGEKLYYLAAFEKGTDLWQYELRTRETKILNKMGDGWAHSLTWDKEGAQLFYLNNGAINRYDTGKNENKAVGIAGEMVLNEDEERAYLFEHIWRQVKKKFYREDLQGVDWDRYKAEYQRFLPHINNNHDMAELCSEMLGELNASHTGAGFREEVPLGDRTAALGCLFDPGPGPGLRIAEVLARGPLAVQAPDVKAGHRIERIDGIAITDSMDWAMLLNRKVDKPVLLAMHDPGTGKRWDVTVKPTDQGDESELLYHRWVERCRHLVDSLSGGQLGYVHVRGMNDDSYRVVYEEALGRYHDRQGLVVDTRFNGGGWLHDDLATFLGGRSYMTFLPRGQDLGTEPQFKYQRPSVVVMSESNYSDAHMFPVTYRALGIGKLVGMPVPGTGTAVWWERLQNGMWFGIPQVGMVDGQGRFLENQQLEPDVKQALDPGPVAQGRDQQLEAAVKLLLGP